MSESLTLGAIQSPPAEKAPSARNKKQKTSHFDAEVIDLTGPDPPRTSTTIEINDDDDDDEVEIVEPPPKVTPVNSDRGGASRDDEDDIQVTGTVNAMRLPHMRPHCTEHPFDANNAASNSETCDLCYCYICDAPVKDCKEWSLHCNATDKGPMAYCWNSMRRSTQASATIVEAHTAHGKLFKNMFHTISKVVKTVCLEFDEAKTMQCQAMNPKDNTIVSIHLHASFFGTFECSETRFLYVNVADVKRALKHVKNASHGIRLRATSSVLTITVADSKTGVHVSSPEPIPLFENHSKARIAIPSQDYDCNAEMSAAEFKKRMSELYDKGSNQTFVIATDRQGISFQRSHMRDPTYQTFFRCSQPLKRPFQVRLNNRLLFDLTRPPPLARTIHLSLSSENTRPTKLAYQLDGSSDECLGHFEMFVCPRM